MSRARTTRASLLPSSLLAHEAWFHPRDLSVILCAGGAFFRATALAWANQLELSGLSIVDALRHYLARVEPPGEMERIDAIFETLTQAWRRQNGNVYTEDAIYLLLHDVFQLDTCVRCASLSTPECEDWVHRDSEFSKTWKQYLGRPLTPPG